jgi:hypothetical protein
MTTSARVMVPVKIAPAMIGAGTTIPEPNTAGGEVAWVAEANYAVDDLRTYSGSVYSCIKAHSGCARVQPTAWRPSMTTCPRRPAQLAM